MRHPKPITAFCAVTLILALVNCSELKKPRERIVLPNGVEVTCYVQERYCGASFYECSDGFKYECQTNFKIK